MNEKYAHFLSPLTIRGKTWKNRSVAAPMGGAELTEGHLNEHGKFFIDFYTQGDLAEYIVGETDISAIGSRMPGGIYVSLWDEKMQQGMKECSDYIHSHDVIAMVELCHCGATKHNGPEGDVLGPSDMFREEDGVQVRGMTREEIYETAADFASAAKAVKAAGFDGVVIHAGHEWLPHQFMSTRTNFREDEFGGSVENRARFLVLVMDAIREACGEDFIIEVRLSGSENDPNPGYTLEESCDMCAIYGKHCDIIHISAGRYYNPVDSKMMSCMYQDHGCNVDVAAEIKKHVDIPVAVVGGINDPDMCEDIIASGKADLVIMGRQRLADPLFVQKCEQGRENEIRGCLRCMRCFPGPMEHVMAEVASGVKLAGSEKNELAMPDPGSITKLDDVLPQILEQLTRCTVNPEFKYGSAKNQPGPERTKRVLVIGGGCAGMQAAITAADRGHTVTLIEKTDRLGGILNFAEEDDVKYDLAKLARAMEAELAYRKVDVRMSTAFSPALLEELHPDAVITAVGSAVTAKNVPGLDSAHVLSAMDAYKKDMRFGNHAVVIGGGQTGCETAEHIGRTGCKVTLVVKYDRLCPDAYRLHGIKLRQLLEEQGCDIRKDTICTEVTPEGVKLKNRITGEEEFVAADCVINALGMQAVPYQDIETACAGLEFYAIGDCIKARNICDALEEGYLTAIKL